MNYFLLIILSFAFTCVNFAIAKDCSEYNIKLVGDVVFNNPDGDGKILKQANYNEFPKSWNVNSDYFESLYIDNKSNNKVTHVNIELKSLQYKDYKFNKTLIVEAKKNKFQKIQNINFKKDIFPTFKLLPANMFMKVLEGENELCLSEYKLEVIQ